MQALFLFWPVHENGTLDIYQFIFYLMSIFTLDRSCNFVMFKRNNNIKK